MSLPGLDLSRVRVVTFDAGGTLLAPTPSVGKIYAEVLMKHGVAIEPKILNERFREVFKTAVAVRPRVVVNEETEISFWREVVRQCVTPECPENLLNRVFAQLWEEFASERRWLALPGVQETLTVLAARRRVRLAVLSNWDSRLPRILDGLDLRRNFSSVFISSEIGAEKPDARAFRAVEKALGLPAEACLHVGDNYAHDYAAARAAGWQAILLASTPLASDPAAVCVKCLDELIKLPL